MLSYEENIRAILECNCTEIKDEIITRSVKQIMRLKMYEDKYYKLFIRKHDIMASNTIVVVEYVKGTKKDLFAYIGWLYSTSLEKIERVDYKEVEAAECVPGEIYSIAENGNLRKESNND